jgi:hypothetical protein
MPFCTGIVAHASIAAQRLQGKSLVVQKEDPTAITEGTYTEAGANPVTVRVSLSFSKITNGASHNKAQNNGFQVADFTVQAVIISALHRAFPADRFIAEETSSQLLAAGGATVAAVAEAAAAAALPGVEGEGGLGSVREVCDALDLGSSGLVGGWSATGRTWVLDPIDGTKGEEPKVRVLLNPTPP